MKKYIALFRGINVGGHKKILMADLRLLFEFLGFTEVQTYIQSGNVVFSSNKREGLAEIIAEEIKKTYGWEVPILVITAEEIKDILNKCPFQNEKKEKSYFMLLYEAPSKENIELTHDVKFPGEEFFISKECVYLYTEIGAGKTKLTNNYFEKKLKVTATSRNFRTIVKLIDLALD